MLIRVLRSREAIPSISIGCNPTLGTGASWDDANAMRQDGGVPPVCFSRPPSRLILNPPQGLPGFPRGGDLPDGDNATITTSVVIQL